jgi:hypothetical protein
MIDGRFQLNPDKIDITESKYIPKIATRLFPTLAARRPDGIWNMPAPIKKDVGISPNFESGIAKEDSIKM